MAKFRTKFYELLSKKELEEGRRYKISDIAESVGVSRVTLYKYADTTMNSVDARTVNAFLDFFGLSQDEVDQFLMLDNDPQSNAQGGRSAGAKTLKTAAITG